MQKVPAEQSEDAVQPPGITHTGHEGHPFLIGVCRLDGQEQVGIMGQFKGGQLFIAASCPLKDDMPP